MNPAIMQIDGWMDEIELNWLFNTARQVPDGGLIIEIGAWKGRSSATLYEGAGVHKAVVSIDTWMGQDDLPNHVAEVAKHDIFSLYMQNMEGLGFTPQPYQVGRMGQQYLISDSVEAAKHFPDGSIHVCFIDGDHRKCGADIDAWLPKIIPDGIICGHDYFCFFETVQVEIHKRFYIHQLHHSIWVRYVGPQKPAWYTL